MILNKEEINTLDGSNVWFPGSVWTDSFFCRGYIGSKFCKIIQFICK